jgi:hypothetical protein
VSRNCALLIHDLLQYNIEQRLGCGNRGALDLIEHPWFDQINFWNLYQQIYLAPFIPIRKNFLPGKYFTEPIFKFTASNQYEHKFDDF